MTPVGRNTISFALILFLTPALVPALSTGEVATDVDGPLADAADLTRHNVAPEAFDASGPAGAPTLARLDLVGPGTDVATDGTEGGPAQVVGYDHTLGLEVPASPEDIVADLLGRDAWASSGSDAGATSMVEGLDLTELTNIMRDLHFDEDPELLDDGTIRPEGIVGGDDRVRVTGTTGFPWRSVVKIYMETSPGVPSACSGAMIGPHHILTAAHCIRASGSTGNWYGNIRIVPGMDDGWNWGVYDDAPLGMNTYSFAHGVFSWVWTPWTENDPDEQWQHDIAVTRLDRNLGSYTGWMGLGWASAGHSWYTGTLNNAGYPSDLDNARNMYFNAASGCGTDGHQLDHSLDTWGGQSGSPIWRLESGNRFILAAHTGGPRDTNLPACSNTSTRLVEWRFDHIQGFLNDDPNPTDLADLTENVGKFGTLDAPDQTVTDLRTTAVKPGGDVRFDFGLKNIGTKRASDFAMDFRLSTDTTITSSDPLITTINEDRIDGLSTITYVNWGGSIPASTPDGVYRLGWNIDPSGAVPEFSDGKNIDWLRGDTLRVDGTAPTTSVSAPSVATAAYTVTYGASDSGVGLSGTMLLQERADLLSSTWTTVCSVSVSGSSATHSCTRNPLVPGEYCYRVVAQDALGNQATGLGTACTLKV